MPKGSLNNNFAIAAVTHRPRGVDTSVDAARTSAQCHLVLQYCECCRISGADPQVCAGPPGPAVRPKNQELATHEKPAGGPAADGGVCPTIHAGVRRREN